MKRILCLALAASVLSASAATAGSIPFNSGWKEQKFSLFSKNRYSFGSSTLGVSSDGAVSMYVVFLPEADAQAAKGKGIRALLSNNNARVLVYVWGGNHGRGQVLASPYLGNRGKTVVLRNAGTGSHSENVNLASDYKRAFGGSAGAVVGIAVSADSDDTSSQIKGAIANLSLQ